MSVRHRFTRRFAAALLIPTLTLAMVASPGSPADARTTAEIVIHVAPNGNDSASGDAAAPVATLPRAQQLVREIRARGNGPVAVEIADGTYSLAATLKLTALDAGTPEMPVVWRAAPGAKPVISGGRALTLQWSDYQNGTKVANVDGALDFDQLYINGQRQVLARYPNNTPGQILNGYAADALAPARVARWSNPTTGFVRALHERMWGGNSAKIVGVNADGTAQTQWVGDNQRGSGLHATYRMVENIFEELDAPGEWFHDRKAGKLYYRPAAGVDLASAKVTTAELPELVRIEGTGAGAPVTDISFEGLTFTGTHRTLFTGTFEPVSLSDWAIVRQAAVVMHNTARVNVKNSTFAQVGGNAIFVDGYAQGNVIDGNTFTGSGASDVAVVGRGSAVREYSTWGHEVRNPSDKTPGPKTEDYPRDVTVSRNLMSQMGQFEKQSAGVEISIASRIKVLSNTIHDGPRAGINIGDGTWGGHLIQGNDLYNLVQETGDHGPINAWGRDRFWAASGLSADQRKAMAFLDAKEPTRIDHNRIWHSNHWGIDLDDGSGNYVLTNNLLLNSGVKLREGYRRIVENNIFVNGGVHSHVSYPATEDAVRKNVFFGQTPYYFIGVDQAAAAVAYDNNTFYNNGGAVDVVNDQWKAAGRDVHSVIADPRPPQSPWQVPAMRDFTLAADSPALSRGFVNFAMNTFGKPGFSPASPPVQWGSTEVVKSREWLLEPWQGAQVSGIYSAELASSVGLAVNSGLYLSSVTSGGVAAQSGLLARDVIRTVNGTSITDKNSFWKAWNVIPAGTTVTLDVWRDQKPVTVTLQRPAGAEKINNTSGITYTGTGWDWKYDERGGVGGYLTDIDASNVKGASFNFSFTGTRLTMSTQKNSDAATFEISIDGGAWTTVSLNNATRVHQQQVFDSGTLAAGTHTVEARNVSENGRWFVVDSFTVTR